MREKPRPDRPVAQTKDVEPQHRAPYEPPELVEYGSVTKLTQGTLSRQSDGPGGGFRMMMCL